MTEGPESQISVNLDAEKQEFCQALRVNVQVQLP